VSNVQHHTTAPAVSVGTRITPYRVRPSTVQLFRFSAVTWNAHRIHYDAAYARSEGYADVVVQSHLHGCFLANAVLAWAGPGAYLSTFGWENRAVAVAGVLLTVTGTVTALDTALDNAREGGRTVAEVTLEEHDEHGTLCAPGHARVVLPGGIR